MTENTTPANPGARLQQEAGSAAPAGRILASTKDPVKLARAAARLKGIDWPALDEAKQVEGVTYADCERPAPVHDSVARRGYPVFYPNPAAAVLRNQLDALYPPPGGKPVDRDELLRQVDAITGTSTGPRPAVAAAPPAPAPGVKDRLIALLSAIEHTHAEADMAAAARAVAAVQNAGGDYEARRAFMGAMAELAGVPRYGVTSGRITGGAR